MDFRKFKNYRIDLEEIMAFAVYPCKTEEKGYHHKIYFYPKNKGKEYFEVYYDTVVDRELFQEAISMLDNYFSVKTEEVSKILP